MIRIVLITAALAAPFLFPYPFALGLSFAASLLFPPTALIAGALTDAAYYVSAASALPLALLTGAGISVGAVIIRRFAQSRLL